MGELQTPRRLRELGIPKESVPKLAVKLLSFNRLVKRTPKQLSREDTLKLFEEMW